jgi:hypothetical protein
MQVPTMCVRHTVGTVVVMTMLASASEGEGRPVLVGPINVCVAGWIYDVPDFVGVFPAAASAKAIFRNGEECSGLGFPSVVLEPASA